ncbi:hypothetical protein YN1_7140 [Nanoarchaeota archaeon]
MDKREKILKVTKEWLDKADKDLRNARILLNNGGDLDIIIFLLQQSVEKYIKSFLVYNNLRVPKTHDIKELIDLCSNIDPDFKKLYEIGANKLYPIGIEVRYPGNYEISYEMVIEFLNIAEKVKEFILKKLNF